MAKSRLTEEDTRDRDRWRNLVLGEGNQLYNKINVYVNYYEWMSIIKHIAMKTYGGVEELTSALGRSKW